MTFECTVRCSLRSLYKTMKRASYSSFRFIVHKVTNETPNILSICNWCNFQCFLQNDSV
jgi:hypothetical protein